MFTCLLRRVADVLTHEICALDLNKVALVEQTALVKHLGEQTGHGRLASAGIALKDHMKDDWIGSQVKPLPLLLNVQKREDLAYGRLYIAQTSEFIKLR